MSRKQNQPGGDDIQADMREVENAWNEATADAAREPAELVDRAVMNMAARAISENTEPSPVGRLIGRLSGSWRGTWHGTWPSLLGMAAVLVLTLTIVLDQRRIGPPPWTAPARTSETKATIAEAPESDAPQSAALEPSKRDARRPDEAAQSELGGARDSLPSEVEAATGTAPAAEPVHQYQRLHDSDDQRKDELRETWTAENAAENTASADSTPPAAKREADQGETEADRVSAARQETSPEEPESWIARIRRLQELGEDARVEREIQAFRAAWPQHPLPEDILSGPK